MTSQPSYGNSWPTPPPPQPPKIEAGPKRVHWLWIVLVGFLCFLFGIGCGATTTSRQAPTSPVSAPAPYSAVPAPYSVTPAPAPVVNGVTDGVYKVGDEVAPGEYRSPGPQESWAPSCYVHVKDGANYLEQKVSNGGQVRITIPPAWIGAELEIRGCQPFVKIG